MNGNVWRRGVSLPRVCANRNLALCRAYSEPKGTIVHDCNNSMKKIKELTETELEAIVGKAAIAIGNQLNRSPEDLLAEVIKRQAEVFRKGFADGATLTDAVEHLKAQGLQVGRRTLKGALQKAGVRIVSRRRIASVAKAAQADAVQAAAK